jgi:hypothetical protein
LFDVLRQSNGSTDPEQKEKNGTMGSLHVVEL